MSVATRSGDRLAVEVTRTGPRGTGLPPRLEPHQLPQVLRGGDTVVIGHGGGWPRRAVRELVYGAPKPFTIVHNRIEDALPYFDGTAPQRVRHAALMVSRSSRQHVASARADYIPNSYGHTPELFRSGAVRADLVILHLSPPDGEGYCSLGTCSAYLPAAVEQAGIVVGQVNQQMPYTFGTSIHMRQLDYVCEVDEPLYTESPVESDEVAERIARGVASLIEDGATLQTGIGKLADTILRHLADRSDLRMFSETFGDAAARLLRAGVLVNGPEGEPAVTATFVTGERHLYDQLHRNSDVRIVPVDLTNDPGRLGSQRGLVAVNSGIEIDLTGQVNAEAIDGTLYSGVGGHLDFAIGANIAPGGRYVLALPSTARGASRIVPMLAPRTPVTIPRSLSGYVVTEFGIAELRGKNLRERAEALIEVAHPDHRPTLERSLTAPRSKAIG